MAHQERPVFSLAWTLLIASVLGLPFLVLSFTKPKQEPWPAIILPAGASLITVRNGAATFDVLTVVGIRGKEELARLDPVDLLNPIPDWYLGPLAERGFGQDDTRVRSLRARWGLFTVEFERTPPDAVNRQQVLEWLKRRVRAQWPDADRVSIRTDTVTVTLETGTELRRVSGDERTIQLP